MERCYETNYIRIVQMEVSIDVILSSGLKRIFRARNFKEKLTVKKYLKNNDQKIFEK